MKNYIYIRPFNGRKYFWSNCLVAAIVAKIKKWNKVKIFYIAPRYNGGGHGFPHFIWYDKDDNLFYDFYRDEELPHWWNCLWWKGYIRFRTVNGFLNWYLRRKK